MEWFSTLSISLGESLFLQITRYKNVAIFTLLYFSQKILKLSPPVVLSPSQCKWQHNENQPIPGVQIANYLSGFWDHQKNRRLYQTPDSIIIKKERDFRHVFKEKFARAILFLFLFLVGGGVEHYYNNMKDSIH